MEPRQLTTDIPSTFLVQEGRPKPKSALSPDASKSPILIAGAGVAGVASALALSDLGLESILLDQRSKKKLVGGAGINLQAKAIEALNALGITTVSLIDSGHVITKQSYYCSDGRHVCTLDKSGKDHSTPGQIAIHRGRLLQLLLDAAASKGIEVLTNHRVVEIDQTTSLDSIIVKAEENSSSSSSSPPIVLDGSMVLGADGISSNIRSNYISGNRNKDPLHYHGITHYRGVVDNFPSFLDGATMIVAGGLDAKVVVYPIGSRCKKGMQTINWVVAVKEEEANKMVNSHSDHILDLLSTNGFDLDFLDLASLIQSTPSIRAWPMADLDPLETWIDGRIGLVGDAAHAMLPVGSGGTMAALFDAFALREAFEKSGCVAASDVLRLYQCIRYKGALNQQQKCRLQPAEQVVQVAMDTIPRTSKIPLEYGERIRDAMKTIQRPPSSADEIDVEGGIKKRVLIVGAGASGLAACKEFAEKGFAPVVFESGGAFGGVYRDAYQNLQLTSSSAFTAFSDYPATDELPTMWSASEYLRYLHRYSVDNEIFPKIQFNSTVVGVQRTQHGMAGGEDTVWEVTIYNSATKKTNIIRGGKLVLCVGSNAKPSIPMFSGQETFSGKIIHTSEIDGFEMFRGKRVLCLGIGESGSDLPYWIAKEPGTTVTIAARGLGWCVPRRRPLNTGAPTDLNTNRLLWGLPRYFNRALSFILAFFDACMDSDPVIRRMGLLNMKHPVGIYKTYGTKNVSFLTAIEHLGASYVGATIASMGPGNHVEFVNGSEGEFDIVLLNTGYTKSSFEGFCFPPSMKAKHDQALYSVLSEASYVRNLYKRVVHPALKNLYFIGFARPGFASIPAIAETQARWAASVASGLCAPFPTEDVMIAEIAADKAREEQQFDGASARVSTLVDYLPYVSDIASLLGATPPYLKMLVTHPSLFLKIFLGPATVAQFRFRGPDAKPDVALSTIRGYPPIPKRRLTFIALGLYLLSLVVLFLSLVVPMTLAARKNLQPVGFPPLRSQPILVARYMLFCMHLLLLACFYATVTGIPEIALVIVSITAMQEIQGYLRCKKKEEEVRRLLTSAAVANLDTRVCGADKMAKADEEKGGKRAYARFIVSLPFAMVVLWLWPSSAIFASGFQDAHYYSSTRYKRFLAQKRKPSNDPSSLTTTIAGGGLLDKFTKAHDLSPLERVALTSSGNLQQIISAYHNQPVTALIERFEQVSSGHEQEPLIQSPLLRTYEREVSLKIGESGRTICEATSRVRIYSSEVAEFVQDEEVSIGKLLAQLNLRPTFTLHDAGRNEEGGLWRLYSLACHEVIECDILEDFSSCAWDINHG